MRTHTNKIASEKKHQSDCVSPVRIAFDAMGGDYAPYEIVKGALLAAKELDIQSILVGETIAITKIINELTNGSKSPNNIEIVYAPEIVNMGEKNPAKAVKSAKQSSIVIANQLVADRKADAVIAAGNTGAATAASLFILGRIKNFERPCIATLIPTHKGKMLLVDAGSNVETNSKQMFQNARLGAVLARIILKEDNPKIGLLNIGEEPSKGNEFYKSCHELLAKMAPKYDLNFIGNVEGKNIIDGICHVAVCDGFTGNIHLKALEGGIRMVAEAFKQEFNSNPLSMIAGGIMKQSGAIDRIKRHFDPSEFGGALLGGLNHVSIISHGSSNAEAIKNAAKHAKLIVENKVVEKLTQMVKF